MTIRHMSPRLLTSVATIALAAVASPVLAQAVPGTTEDAVPSDDSTEASSDNVIVVTGSMLRRDNVETALPVTVITSESLELAGITNTQDAVRAAAADGAGSIGVGFSSGFSAGGSPFAA